MNLLERTLFVVVSLLIVAVTPDTARAETIPDKMVVLTFDDASASHATIVAPLLKKYGFGATFFVCEFPPDFETAKDKYMTWEQIGELHRMGFEIGNHTRTHRHMNALKPEELTAELQFIEDRCAAHGIPRPTAFAYPAYISTPAAMTVLAERGYAFARAGGSLPYDPAKDDPRAIPSVSTTGADLARLAPLLSQARNGKIVILTSHGVPDVAHPHVTTSPEAFERLLQYLRDEHFTVIAMRDLARYQPARVDASRRDAAKPTLFLIGDSTVRNSTAGLMGWGSALGPYFDPEKITVTNAALGGRSSRSFLREGLWEKVREQVKPGDFVLMQFGHNDGGPLDSGKARASLKGNGSEAREVTIQETGAKETVLSYGGYLRRYIADTQAKGAIAIVASPIPRNIWADRRVGRNDADYGKWAAEAAQQTGALFIELNTLLADRYDAEGPEKVGSIYFTATDHTHTTVAGAEVAAVAVVAGLRRIPASPLPGLLPPKERTSGN